MGVVVFYDGSAPTGMFVNNAGGTPSIQTGTFAARPAFGTSGRIYVANDTQQIFEDTGAAWVLIGGGGGGLITANSGLRQNPAGNVQLDNGSNPLLQNTIIDSTGAFSINIGDFGAQLALLTIDPVLQVAFLGVSNLANTIGSFINLNLVNSSFAYFDAGGQQEILMQSSAMFVTDTINSKGMQYAADYSAVGELDNRWIPDWGAVKGLPTIYSADGALAGNRNIDFGASKMLSFIDSVNATLQVDFKSDAVHPQINLGVVDTGLPSSGGIAITSHVIVISQSGAGVGTNITLNDASTVGIVVQDLSLFGMSYNADYSALGTLNNRWIPDYAAVKAAITAAIPATVVASNKLIISGSANIYTYAVPAGVVNLYRVNASMCFESGVGTTAINVTYTDGGGNLNVKTIDTLVAPGGSFTASVNIFAAPATNIIVDFVVTGAPVAQVVSTLEFLL